MTCHHHSGLKYEKKLFLNILLVLIHVKVRVVHYGNNTYCLSCQELDEKTDITHTCLLNLKLTPAASYLILAQRVETGGHS